MVIFIFPVQAENIFESVKTHINYQMLVVGMDSALFIVNQTIMNYTQKKYIPTSKKSQIPNIKFQIPRRETKQALVLELWDLEFGAFI
jgi:hypothetical protein